MRVFHDRLVCNEDKEYVTRKLHDMLTGRFEVRDNYEDIFVKNTILFGTAYGSYMTTTILK
jgi:hypothetical protein